MMKRIGTLLLLTSLFAGGVNAQQLPQYTQYLFNEYAVNPAVAGTEPYYEVRSNHRYQWVGITDAPRTYTLSAHGPSKDRKMGFGGYLFTDIVGPTRRTGMQLSYAYHLKLGENLKLSAALAAGVLQFQIDASKITFEDNKDEAINNELYSELNPDAKFGLHLYTDKWFIGAVAPQLLQNKLGMFELPTTLSRLEDHYIVTGGYTFDIGDKFQFEPTLLAKYVYPTPPKLDVSGRFIYDNSIWAGGSYRTNDAVAIMAGYNYKNKLQIGYSHDLTTTNIKNYSTGTHEIMLGIRLHGKDKGLDDQKILN